MNGELPKEYTPGASPKIKIESVLIPVDQVYRYYQTRQLIDNPSRSVLQVTLEGKKYFRAFYHPYTIKKRGIDLSRFLKDPVEWEGTPSSSSRTLYLKPVSGSFPAFQGKLSLDVTNGGGYNRLVKESSLQRAIVISDILEDLHQKTKGKIADTDKKWNFFREQEAIYPLSDSNGGSIARMLPNDYGEAIYISWFALIADRGAGKIRWIDELFLNSGYTNKQQFVWFELVKPLVELDGMFSIENGISTMFHQQNVVLKVNPRTKRIEEFEVKDLDSSWIDYAVRKKFGLWIPQGENFAELADRFGFIAVTSNPIYGYEFYTMTSAIHSIFKYFLKSDELEAVKMAANRQILSRFNSTFGKKYSAKTFAEIASQYKNIYRDILPENLKSIYAKVLADRRRQTSLRYQILDSITQIHLRSFGARLSSSACNNLLDGDELLVNTDLID